MTASNHLPYQPVTPTTRRAVGWRQVGRRLAVPAVTVAAAVLCWWVGPQLRYLWHQSACLDHRNAAEFVVFQGDPGAAAMLAGRPDFVHVPLSPAPFSSGTGRAGETAAFYQSPTLDRLGWQSPYYQRPLGLAFMHERRSKSGMRRLVVVMARVSDANWRDTQSIMLTAFALEPATLVPGSRVRAPPRFGYAQIQSGPDQTLAVYAGQPDPLDDSHLRIRYSMGGHEGWIDGWLTDPEPWAFSDEITATCERVKLVVQDGPAIRRRKFPRLRPNSGGGKVGGTTEIRSVVPPSAP